MGIAGLELSKVNTVEFVYQEHNLGSATMAQSIFKNELRKAGVTKVAARQTAANEQPIDIIACENMIGGSQFLKKEVYKTFRSTTTRVC